jgi:hypothetical protein
MLDGSHYAGSSRTPNAKTEKQNQYLSASKRIIKGKYQLFKLFIANTAQKTFNEG